MSRLSDLSYTGDNICDFLIVNLHTKFLLKKSLFSKENEFAPVPFWKRVDLNQRDFFFLPTLLSD